MAKPNNLSLDFSDYCCNCIRGDYEINTIQNFSGYSYYSIRCIYQDVCSYWASLLDKKEEFVCQESDEDRCFWNRRFITDIKQATEIASKHLNNAVDKINHTLEKGGTDEN